MSLYTPKISPSFLFVWFSLPILLFSQAIYGEMNIKDTQTPTIILSTIAPISKIAENFLEHACPLSKVQAQSIIPQNNDPHLFEPKFSSIYDLQNTLIWFRNGEPMEQHLCKLFNRNKITIIDLRELIDPLYGNCCHQHTNHSHHRHQDLSNIDPHFWLSIHNLKTVVTAIYQNIGYLLSIDPQEVENILETDLQRIETAHRALTDKIRAENIRALCVNHPALSYLCHDLGIAQLYAESDGRPLSIKETLLLQEQITQFKVQSMNILQPYSQTTALSIAKQQNLKINYLSPYAHNPIVFLEQMVKIAFTTKDCSSCNQTRSH